MHITPYLHSILSHPSISSSSSQTPPSLPNTMTPLATSHLRIARPTDNLPSLEAFYISGLGMTRLSSFTDHAGGFSGLIVGYPSAPYHLEFVQQAGHTAGRAPGKENLLVFYVPDEAEWRTTVERMEKAGWEGVESGNPWWERAGRTFEDPVSDLL
ncbi:Glyoxalase/Bleomycin resistance protein/Dihydroxybiphenyl dioxygenase [Myriangium duriaei CBS 260.36]|uniref:Glyoxalase/Bleomycin resistance protein/Dihydroxybiphenyl dioxygenase n=1 Tax=Myriangium duriaei CBS 260.36 TaxID=1168546 RepID=A0A9P4IZC6_9PEZI|nr:Glyoxalase/Bleomycin resistance protein/Dihydroxybiphenyl dioxygenase [Myriangium duriaei CBS 260.36]